MNKIKLILLVIMLLGVMTNCEEEEISNTGKLSLSFANNQPNIKVAIYSIDNTEIAIDNLPINIKGQGQKDLNIGNYYLRVFADTPFPAVSDLLPKVTI